MTLFCSVKPRFVKGVKTMVRRKQLCDKRILCEGNLLSPRQASCSKEPFSAHTPVRGVSMYRQLVSEFDRVADPEPYVSEIFEVAELIGKYYHYHVFK